MSNRELTPDAASAFASIKSILAIINGLTLTNTLLVLITGAHYSRVIPLADTKWSDRAFAIVLMVNIVRFYHGNMRHLDAAYGSESLTPARSGRHAEPRGGLGLDFFVVFTQSVIFAVTSFYVSAHSDYMSLIIVLLLFDVLWVIYSALGTDAATGDAQRVWLLTNLVAVIVLVVLQLAHHSHPSKEWTLDAALGVLTVATVVDFALNWRFYFPLTRPSTPAQ